MSYKDREDSLCYTLHEAARNGDLHELNRLIDIGFPLDEGDTRGWRPLHEAAFNNHIQCLECLLDQEDTDVNWASFEKQTALHMACIKGHVQIVSRLLAAGADPAIADHMATYPIHLAARAGSLTCVEMLVNKGTSVNVQNFAGSSPLHLASCHGHENIVAYLITHGADTHIKEDYGITALFCTAQHGHTHCCRRLLENAMVKGDSDLVDITADDNATPLYLASQEGHTDIVRLLLEHGASANIPTHSPISLPLHAATQFNHASIVRLLLPHIDLTVLDKCDMSPFYFCLFNKDTSCTEAIIQSGISPSRRHLVQADSDFKPRNLRYFQLNVRYSKRQCPLVELAMNACSLDHAKVLLDSGAAVDARTPHEVSPLLAALEYKRYKLAALLISRGASVNIYHPKVICNMTLVVSYCHWEGLDLLLRCSVEAESMFAVSPRPSKPLTPASHRLAELEDAMSDQAEEDYENEIGVLRYPIPFWRLLAETRMNGRRITVAEMLHRVLLFVGTVRLDHKFQGYVDSKEEWQSLCSITDSPRVLTHLCRINIRQKIGSQRLIDPSNIQSLPLPLPVIDYLLYAELDS